MSALSKDLLIAALNLSELERATNAGALLRSLDPNPAPDAEAVWASEIERPVKAIDEGGVELIPWDAVMMKMRDLSHSLLT